VIICTSSLCAAEAKRYRPDNFDIISDLKVLRGKKWWHSFVEYEKKYRVRECIPEIPGGKLQDKV
jgi:hypothetical protein